MKTIRTISACLIALGISEAVKAEIRYRVAKRQIEWEFEMAARLLETELGRNPR